MRAPRAGLGALGAFLALGCDAEPYCFNCAVDSAYRVDAVEVSAPDAIVPVDTARTDRGADTAADRPGDVPADACVGVDFTTDVRHCGGCGRACAPAHAFPACRMGVCAVMSCDSGFYDIDGDPSNGCEYACSAVPGATQDNTCDGRDDDCDQRVDEDVDLCADPANCGACGRECNLPNATGRCERVAGAASCTRDTTRCAVNACAMGFYDIDGDPANGCEYACTATGAEVCDNRDNDCDGMVDEDDPGGGGPCGSTLGLCRAGALHCRAGSLRCEGGVEPAAELCDGMDNDCNGRTDDGDLRADPRVGVGCGTAVGDCRPGSNTCVDGSVRCTGAVPGTLEVCDGRDNDCNGMVDDGIAPAGPCGRAVGACRPGSLTCAAGRLVCTGGVGPVMEVCNGVDDDCDTVVDNGVDLLRDPTNCGRCGVNCGALFPHAVGVCNAGRCEIGACEPGYFDDPATSARDCNYRCEYRGAVEVCNGEDDNCNGVVDEGVTPPAGFCRTLGPCAGTMPRCDGRLGLRCAYPSTVEVDPTTGQPVGVETRCDGVDNNCNGGIDESFSNLSQPCASAGVGACATSGRVVCNAAGTGTVCNAGPPGVPSAELCDGADNDCDGVVDETALAPGPAAATFVRTPWVALRGTGAATVWIMQYEASRPGATATAPGAVSNRACAVAGVLPWTNLTASQAATACNAAGARLCTEDEWTSACRSQTGACTWSYGSACSTYSASTCNGADFDADPTVPGLQSAVLPTGRLAACFAPFAGGAQLFDLSGNVKEFTTARGAGANPLRGGAHSNIAYGTACAFDWTVVDDAFAFSNAGFRCCYTGATPP